MSHFFCFVHSLALRFLQVQTVPVRVSVPTLEISTDPDIYHAKDLPFSQETSIFHFTVKVSLVTYHTLPIALAAGKNRSL